jgi:hypothetical protein
MSDTDAARLAAIHYDRGDDVDALLLESCDQLRPRGLRIGGLVQKSVGKRDHCAASVHVTDLSSGQTFDIWEDRGACARGCRLDEAGLLDAEPALAAAIAERVDLLVINRFGRAESLGRGLIGSFAAALAAGIPVLTAVRPPYDDAWRAFHGGIGHKVIADPQAVIAWVLSITKLLSVLSPRAA